MKWRPVAWGLALQIIFGIIILRWSFGYQAFKWLGDRVHEFLKHSDAGSEFVFGKAFRNHFVAFAVRHFNHLLRVGGAVMGWDQ